MLKESKALLLTSKKAKKIIPILNAHPPKIDNFLHKTRSFIKDIFPENANLPVIELKSDGKGKYYELKTEVTENHPINLAKRKGVRKPESSFKVYYNENSHKIEQIEWVSVGDDREVHLLINGNSIIGSNGGSEAYNQDKWKIFIDSDGKFSFLATFVGDSHTYPSIRQVPKDKYRRLTNAGFDPAFVDVVSKMQNALTKDKSSDLSKPTKNLLIHFLPLIVLNLSVLTKNFEFWKNKADLLGLSILGTSLISLKGMNNLFINIVGQEKSLKNELKLAKESEDIIFVLKAYSHRLFKVFEYLIDKKNILLEKNLEP